MSDHVRIAVVLAVFVWLVVACRKLSLWLQSKLPADFRDEPW